MNQKITIYDIAELAGVSPATVSRVIHQPDCVKESTKQKVWNAFTEAKITPDALSFKESARKKKDSRLLPHVPTVLVCLPNWNNPFYNDILEGIRTFLLTAGYEMIVQTKQFTKYSVPEFLEFAASVQAAGLIIMNPLSEDILYRLKAHYPLVQCSEHNPFCQNIPYVSVDDEEVSKTAISYLIQNGCKKIGFFSAPYQNQYVQKRFLAYKTVLQAYGMPMQPDHIIQVSDFSYDRILAAANRFFMLSEPPDAVFAVSDKHAHAVIKAGLINGYKIPEDIRVIGFDDTMYATLSTPTITTIHQPRRELGAESARILLELIRHPDKPQEGILLPAHMVWRESA